MLSLSIFWIKLLSDEVQNKFLPSVVVMRNISKIKVIELKSLMELRLGFSSDNFSIYNKDTLMNDFSILFDEKSCQENVLRLKKLNRFYSKYLIRCLIIYFFHNFLTGFNLARTFNFSDLRNTTSTKEIISLKF